MYLLARVYQSVVNWKSYLDGLYAGFNTYQRTIPIRHPQKEATTRPSQAEAVSPWLVIISLIHLLAVMQIRTEYTARADMVISLVSD